MATFHGQAEYTLHRNGAVYVFGIKFIHDEPYLLPESQMWMPAEFFVTGVHLEEAMSEQDGLVTMRLPLGWHPVASTWLSSRMDDDQGLFDDVIEVCREEYLERTAK